MKIFVDLQQDNNTYHGYITPALQKLGMEVTHNIDDDFDDAIMTRAQDSYKIASSLKSKGLPSFKYDICDKWNLYNFLKDNNMSYVPTSLPNNINDVINFFNEHGAFIVKPRIGGAGCGDWGMHYNTYSSVDEFISDTNGVPNFWEVQTTEEDTIFTVTKKIVLQKYITEDDGTTIGFRMKCSVNDKSEFVYTLTTPKRRTIINTPSTSGPKIWVRGFKLLHEDARIVNDLNAKNLGYETIIRNFIGYSSWKSCFLDLDGILHDGIFYINDISMCPQQTLSEYSVVDDIDYLEDVLKWQYGISDSIQYTIGNFIVMNSWEVPGGVTREKLIGIETKDIRRTDKTYTGAPTIYLMIRGNTEAEVVENRANMELKLYLNSQV